MTKTDITRSKIDIVRHERPDKYRYQKSSRDVLSFSARTAIADTGCFYDPSAPVDMFYRSAACPLSKMLDEEDFKKVESILNSMPQSHCNLTYRDAVLYIKHSWESERRNNKNFSVYDISNEAYEIYNILTSKFIDEVVRRQNMDKSLDCKDLSLVFPVAGILLPQLFQAAKECAAVPEDAEYFGTLYFNRYDEILRCPQMSNFIYSVHKYQPDAATSYCDLPSAVAIIANADHQNIIKSHNTDDLIYNLMIYPFTAANLPEKYLKRTDPG